MPRAAEVGLQRYTTWRQLDPVLLKAAEILTERDRRLIAALHMHRVLTTEHITQMFFGSTITAQHRLLRLEQHGLLTRFRPWRPRDTAPSHWSVDIPGLVIYEADRPPEPRRGEEDPDALLRRVRRRRQSLDLLAHSSHLTHRIETTSFFTRLIWDARTHDDGRTLSAWWNERRLARELDFRSIHGVRPDGYGAWHQDGRTVEFFLEHDRGTEPLSRLEDKMAAYPAVLDWLGRPAAVLLTLHGRRRFANVVARVLPIGAELGLTVAAAIWGGRTPSQLVWHLADRTNHCSLRDFGEL